MYRFLLVTFAFTFILISPAVAQQTLSPSEWQRNVQALHDSLDGTHPDLEYLTQSAIFQRALSDLSKPITKPISENEALLRLATLNPAFADAHFFIGRRSWRDDVKAHRMSGGGLFPYEVHVDPLSGNVFVLSELGGGASRDAKRRIVEINGVGARKITRRLLSLVHGESLALRARILEQRWFYYYLIAYGAPNNFRFIISHSSPTKRIKTVSKSLPTMLAEEDDFEKIFRFRLLSDDAAVLTLSSFSWPDEDRFFKFTQAAFEQMRAANVRTLIIDVRNNGGGDDEFWMRGVLPYIADKRYRVGSKYRKRIIAGRQAPGQSVGDVVTGSLDNWIEPQPENPLRFSGRTYLLVGTASYSSTILLANVMQDFKFAIVAGPAPSAHSRQTGSVQESPLPYGGLSLRWPRFVLDRPSGSGSTLWSSPDLRINDDPYDKDASIRAVLRAAKR